MKIKTLEQLVNVMYPKKVYEVTESGRYIKSFIVVGYHPRDKKSVILNNTSSINSFEVWSNGTLNTKLHYVTDSYDEAQYQHIQFAIENVNTLKSIYKV